MRTETKQISTAEASEGDGDAFCTTTHWLTTHEAAEISGYSVDYVRKLMRLGKVSGRFRGVMWWVDKESLRAYLYLMDTLGAKRYHPGGMQSAGGVHQPSGGLHQFRMLCKI